CRTVEQFIATQPPLTEWHRADPDDVALLIYTGGTTGRSKGVMHSHRSFCSWSFMNADRGGGHNPDKKTLISNQAHLSGQFMLWTTLYEGGCLIYSDSYPLRTEAMVELIEREQLKYIGTIGLQFRDMAQMLAERGKRLPEVLGISCGGAPMSERTFHLAREVFPNAYLSQVYAQTESGQFISPLFINPCFAEGALHRLLSVGNPAHVAIWGQKPMEVRIVDESGRDVEPGGTGEVICKGDQLMLGYWNNPEETNKALRDGWLYTGDIGTFDDEGFLYLLDRKKDIVIVGGSNVYCSEVEEVVSRHPAIREVAVVGTPLPDEGEEVTAVVVLREGAELALAHLKSFCRDHLASHKIPTRLEFAESLPRTSFGKLNKPEIRKPYWLGRQRMIN
ncbi:MAG: AMP-binding protein, partial [Cohnella sp.]|nr:AMP-binding protein [Cohnella sp.]